MTIALRYIDSVQELETRWQEIWALLEALEVFHADLHNKLLRPGREEWRHQRIRDSLGKGDFWLPVVEQDGEFVGIGSSSIQPSGRTHGGPVGVTGDLFFKESVRGLGLYPRIHEMRVEPLRQRGLALAEDATSAFNTRTIQLLSSKFWGCVLQRPLSASPLPEPSIPIRRLRDLKEDWPGIWRLLEPSSDGGEGEARVADLASRSWLGSYYLNVTL